MSEPTFTLFRCETCGKWSHARRKPKQHRRFTRETLVGDVVLEQVESSYDHMNGFGDDGGYIVACGPFVEYTATRDPS